MKNIDEYNEMEVRTAYEEITTDLLLSAIAHESVPRAMQMMVIDNLLNALDEVKTRASELGIEL